MFKRVKAVICIFFLGFTLSMGITFAGAPIKLDQFGDLGEIIGLEFYNEKYIFLISRKKLFVFIRENNDSDIFPALRYRYYELRDDAVRVGFSRKKQRIMVSSQ